MKKYLESLGVFALILGVFAFILGIWLVFAYGAATLASRLPRRGARSVYVGGGVAMLGLFFALGLAARIVRAQADPAHPDAEPKHR